MKEEVVDIRSTLDGGKTKRRVLIIATVVLFVILVGLIIWIVVSLTEGLSGGNMQLMTAEEKEQAYRQSLIDNDKSYQISLEISTIYNNGGKERALGMYDEELKKALDEKNYELFNELVTARSTMLILDGTCEELMAQYDEIDIDQIPEEYRDPVYENAIGDANYCGDVERETYWRTISSE